MPRWPKDKEQEAMKVDPNRVRELKLRESCANPKSVVPPKPILKGSK